MFILFGTRFIGDISPSVETQKTQCPYCNKETFFYRINGRRYFHIFFFPIFPTSGEICGIKCSVCKKIREVSPSWSLGSEKVSQEKAQNFFEEFRGKNDKEKKELLGKWFDETAGNLFHDGPLELDGKIYKFIQKKQRNLFGTNLKRKLYFFNNATNIWELGDQSIVEKVLREGVPLKESPREY